MNSETLHSAWFRCHERDHNRWKDFDRAVSWAIQNTSRGNAGEASDAALAWARARRDDYHFGDA